MKKRWYLFIVLIIEGASLMAVELISAKLLSPFYGSSLYVWTATLALTILGLSLGYYLGGRLSVRSATENTLFAILFVSALLVFTMPYTAVAVMSITSEIGLIAGICITCLCVIVPPVLCFGMVGPLAVRLMSSEIETLGTTAGAVYFTSTFGGIAATFLFGFYMIPEAGLKFSTVTIAVSLAIMLVVYILARLFKTTAGQHITTGRLDETESRGHTLVNCPDNKADTIKINQWVYLFAAIEGATVMAVELLSARMLAPWFGSSIYVWGAVIGITLFSLALGYFAGGRIADRHTSLSTLLWVLLAAATLVVMMHMIPPEFIPELSTLPPIAAVILISLVLILPSLSLLGMVPTMIIRYLSSQVADAGKITGRVYTISSVSGMMVLPLMGFLLIPTFGITWPSIIIGILAGTVPFVMLISSRKYFTIFFIIAILVSVRSVNPVRSSEDVQVQYLSEGLLGQVMVADINTREWGTGLPPEYDRVMYVNRMGQTYIDLATGESVWEYVPYTIRILAALPAGSEALILGLGGGIVANALADELNFKVDAVELDERIVKIARHYFNLHPSIRVIVDDARHYLETTGKKYDVMVFDVYNGDVIPSHVMSLECFERVKEMLNDRGMIVVNFNGFLQGDTGLPGRSVYRTLTTAGFTTRVLLTPGSGNSRNALFIASLQSSDKDAVQVTAPGAHAGIPDSLFADRQLLTTGEALVLTDDKPVLEKRNFMAASQWRKSYHVYTELFLRQGIPLFE